MSATSASARSLASTSAIAASASDLARDSIFRASSSFSLTTAARASLASSTSLACSASRIMNLASSFSISSIAFWFILVSICVVFFSSDSFSLDTDACVLIIAASFSSVFSSCSASSCSWSVRSSFRAFAISRCVKRRAATTTARSAAHGTAAARPICHAGVSRMMRFTRSDRVRFFRGTRIVLTTSVWTVLITGDCEVPACSRPAAMPVAAREASSPA